MSDPKQEGRTKDEFVNQVIDYFIETEKTFRRYGKMEMAIWTRSIKEGIVERLLEKSVSQKNVK